MSKPIETKLRVIRTDGEVQAMSLGYSLQKYFESYELSDVRVWVPEKKSFCGWMYAEYEDWYFPEPHTFKAYLRAFNREMRIDMPIPRDGTKYNFNPKEDSMHTIRRVLSNRYKLFIKYMTPALEQMKKESEPDFDVEFEPLEWNN